MAEIQVGDEVEGIYTAEGIKDKESLWSGFYYLVRKEALKFHKRLPASVELDDLIQAGAIGFLGAIENYDPKKGVTLSAWITQRVRWAFLDELRERDWVPRRIRTHSREIVSVIQKIEQEMGREATETEIAQEMGVSINELHKVLSDNNSSQIYSIEELQENYDDSWESNGNEQESLDPFNEAFRENITNVLAKHIRFLPEREQRILQMYYQHDMNMKEISLILDLTETRISQLHSLAIKRLRSRLNQDKFG